MKEGWEYKKLGEIGEFVRGGNFSKKDFVEDGFPCIHYGQIHMKFGVETFTHLSSIPAEMVKPDRCAKKGDLVIAITSEDDAGSCKCTAWMGDYDAYVGGHAAIYRHTMQPKYVSYYFLSPFFQKDKLEFTHGFKVVEISPKDIAKIKIPVPPLSEQQFIVDYLDSAFAKIDTMKANTEKALNEAKALFQASLKEMLEPKEGWEEKALGEVCKELFSGGDAPKDNMAKVPTDEYNIPIYANAAELDGLYGYTNYYRVNEPSVTIAARGSGTGLVLKRKGAYLPIVRLIVAIPQSFLSVDYLYFALQIIGIKSNGSAIPQLTVPAIKQYRICYPPIFTEQQTIVATLDSLKSKVDRLQANYDKISQECDALKQAILRQVFE